MLQEKAWFLLWRLPFTALEAGPVLYTYLDLDSRVPLLVILMGGERRTPNQQRCLPNVLFERNVRF
jgi:hypothetical protein